MTTTTMTTTTILTALTAIALTLCGGCDVESDEFAFDAEQEFRPGGWGGDIGFNNDNHKAWHWATDGVRPVGSQMLGDGQLAMVEVSTPGGLLQLDSVWTEDGRLHGSSGVTEFSGADFLDSVWNGRDLRTGGSGSDGRLLEMTLTAVDATGPLDLYEFRVGVDEFNPGENICGDGLMLTVVNDLLLEADGTLVDRPNTLMFACEGGAVAKAVQWGYRPWGPGGNQGFQTGIRMVIADYCGDGTSYTQEGSAIWMRDIWGIHNELEHMNREAGWGPDGATCLSVPRLVALNEVSCENPLPLCPIDPIADGAMLATYLPNGI